MKLLLSFVCTLRFHCCSSAILYSGPATRSESCDVSVRGMNPSVVVGNGFERVDAPLLASVFVKLCANGCAVNKGVPAAFELNGGGWKNHP